MVDLTFPQPADLPDAAYFAFQSGRGRSGIVSGFQLTADLTVPEVTVAAGKAIIDRGNMQTAHPDIQPSETVRDAVAVVQIDPQTISLSAGATNNIFLVANVANDDSATIKTNTTDTQPTPASLKIGEVDTSANAIRGQFNLIEDDGTLSFPTTAAATDALSTLTSGVAVIDRSQNIRLLNAVETDTVETGTITANTSITDASGTAHTGQLADANDPVTDFSPGTVNDTEFLQNSGGSLVGATVQTSPIIQSSTNITVHDGDAVDLEANPVIFDINSQVALHGGSIHGPDDFGFELIIDGTSVINIFVTNIQGRDSGGDNFGVRGLPHAVAESSMELRATGVPSNVRSGFSAYTETL